MTDFEDWYKRYPKKFVDGVQGMGPDFIGAYSVILDLIYTSQRGRCANDPRWLAGIMGCNGRKAAALVAGLVKRGKLQFDDDGFLTNPKAKEVLSDRATRLRHARDTGATGGRRSAETKAANKKNKDLPQAKSKGEEKIREEKKVSKKRASAPVIPGLEFPDWWPIEAWQGFVESRRKMRRPLSDRAITLAVDKLIAAHDRGENVMSILDKSTMNSWQGIFTKEDEENAKGKGQPAARAPEMATVDQWLSRLKAFAFGIPDDGISPAQPKGYWHHTFGPPPTDPACGCPPGVRAQFEKIHPGVLPPAKAA